MHSPHPIVAMLQRWAYRLRQLIPRPPIITDSDVGFMKKLDESVAIKRVMTREQLRHEYGFDDHR